VIFASRTKKKHCFVLRHSQVLETTVYFFVSLQSKRDWRRKKQVSGFIYAVRAFVMKFLLMIVWHVTVRGTGYDIVPCFVCIEGFQRRQGNSYFV